MWRVPTIWEDGRCFIIGGGTSMPRQFGVPESIIQDVYNGKLGVEAYSPYLSAIHSEKTIAVNMAYKIGDWTGVVFWGDGGFWDKQKPGLLDYKGLRCTCMPRLDEKYLPVVKKLTRDPRKMVGLSFRNDILVWNRNSGGGAINLATLFGAKQIVLLGFDMNLDPNKNQHWHKFYSSNPKTVSATFKMHLKCFPAIAEDASKLGVEILNASPDSSITCFKKVQLKDIL